MDKKEVAVLLGILKTAYPRFYLDMGDSEKVNTVNLWTEMLSDVSIEQGKLAFYKLIATSKYPPTIAEVRKAISEVTTGHVADAGDAWGEVVRAIRNYGYMQGEKAFASMSNTTKLAVERMGWQALCASENEMADRSHFFKIYNAIAHREEEKQQIPLALHEKILKSIDENVKPEEPVYLEQNTNLLIETQVETETEIAMEGATESVRSIINNIKQRLEKEVV